MKFFQYQCHKTLIIFVRYILKNFFYFAFLVSIFSLFSLFLYIIHHFFHFFSHANVLKVELESQKIYLCEHLSHTWKQNAWFASFEEKILYKNSRLPYFLTLILTFAPPLPHSPPPALSQSENLQSVPLLSPQIFTPLDVNTTATFPAWYSGSTVMELQCGYLLFFFIHRFPW